MKASALAAMSYRCNHVDAFSIPESIFERHDINVHIPAGVIPKNGTSAGMPIEALPQAIDQVLKAAS